jgi:hypothetical protein
LNHLENDVFCSSPIWILKSLRYPSRLISPMGRVVS